MRDSGFLFTTVGRGTPRKWSSVKPTGVTSDGARGGPAAAGALVIRWPGSLLIPLSVPPSLCVAFFRRASVGLMKPSAHRGSDDFASPSEDCHRDGDFDRGDRCGLDGDASSDRTRIGRQQPAARGAESEAVGMSTFRRLCIERNVTRVIDGDTLDVEGTLRIRLVLVNAPELNASGGPESKDYLTSLCLGSKALVDEDDLQIGDDPYGRVLAVVYCGGTNANALMISSGHATTYYTFCSVSEFGSAAWSGCGSPPPPPPGNCDPAYPDVCIPPPPPDLNCANIPYRNFRVLPPRTRITSMATATGLAARGSVDPARTALIPCSSGSRPGPSGPERFRPS